MASNLLTLGCSFTYQDGWANYIQKNSEYNVINLSIGAGSNSTQIQRFNDFILANPNIKFDAIWQITYLTRFNMRLPPNHPDVLAKAYLPAVDKGFIYADKSPFANYFDKQKHIDILNSDYTNKYAQLLNVNNELGSLMASLLLLKKLSQKCLIFFGDEIFSDSSIKESIERFLMAYQINFISADDSLLGWAKKNNLSFHPDGHPTRETYQQYAQNIILPNFK
jgi:hypothetical protein